MGALDSSLAARGLQGRLRILRDVRTAGVWPPICNASRYNTPRTWKAFADGASALHGALPPTTLRVVIKALADVDSKSSGIHGRG